MTDNEDSLLARQVAPEPKTNRRKMKIAFIAIIFLALLALIGNGVYRYWLTVNSGVQYEKDLASRLEAERLAKMADTYGGKTPAETLQLYIDALKKNDFELASKYFIERTRQKELEGLKSASRDGLAKYISGFADAMPNVQNYVGSYNSDRTSFEISKPFLIDFELYPNGIWKIIEI